MRKFFLIPLMTLCTCVMAWAVEVSTFADLKTALSSAGSDAVVTLANDITYEGTAVLDIQRSLTLDGAGHKLIGFQKTAFKTDGTSEKHNTSIAINAGQFGSTAELDVTIKNLSVGNPSTNARYYGIVAFDGVKKLTLDNINIVTGNYSYQQGLCFTGTQSTPVLLSVANSYINTGNTAYAVYILKPVVGTFTNTTIEGWCGLYFKYRATPMYGAVVGSRHSDVTCDACKFICTNVHNGASNSFAMFPMEDDGISLALHNCSFNAEQIGSEYQALISVQYRTRANATEPISVVIDGDNTHMYNINKDHILDVTDDWKSGYASGTQDPGLVAETGLATSLTIKGGTFSVNPTTFVVKQGDGSSNAPFIDDTKYDVKTVDQGGKTLYRVVPKTTTLYDLNDNVQSQGDGQNPTTSFELSDGSAMTLDQPTTKAGYVEVSNATTVTVANNQTLVINNGLDVQGTSAVTAKPGSALVIGEGGIVTAKPENIVVEADNNGAASLLLDPAITVNQTPELTVKMVAKNVGKIGTDYFWHRFALPVDEVHIDADPAKSTWKKDGHNYGTLLYKWDYTNNKWVSLSDVSEMQPFYGYTMTLEEEVGNPTQLKEAGYIFKGKLMGNVPSVLNFSRQGYNYFGNSYTGYISIVQLVDELIGNDNLDGTVWMWDPTTQKYEGIPLNDLKNNSTASRYTGANSWKAEVAPMQTFILRLMTEDTDTKANINYETAVWGNPRYEDITGLMHAPARRAESNNETYVRVIVSAANGKADAVNFQEGVNFSDANDRGYDAAKYMNERTVNAYATVNGENYGTVATDNIEGQSLTINTIDEIAYTISFADVEGRELALRDNVSGQVIAIEEGATYEFAAQPNSVIEGRFEIVGRNNAPTAIENTEVKANVKGIYTIMGQYLGEDFDILPAGVYVVDGVKIVK